MAIDVKNYTPALMYGATASNAGETVTGTLAVSSTSTLTGAVATGAITTTGTIGATSTLTGKSGTAVPATAGAAAAGVPISMNSNGITIEATTDVPTHNRPIGSICINLGGNSTSTRLYIATSAAGAWAAITTAS